MQAFGYEWDQQRTLLERRRLKLDLDGIGNQDLYEHIEVTHPLRFQNMHLK